jgi:hypothetical protein
VACASYCGPLQRLSFDGERKLQARIVRRGRKTNQMRVLARDIGDPKHWRGRAAQLRALAIRMRGTQAAVLMVDLADDYDKRAVSLTAKIVPPAQ